MNPHECQNQLDWTAFCYLSGEMSPVEAEQFEARLADEQPAREALARAVELTQVVAAAESQCGELAPSLTLRVGVADRRRTSWSTRLAWMAIGGLASVVIAMLWSGMNVEPVAENGLESAGNGALASAWSQTRIQLTGASDIGPLHPISIALNDSDDEFTADADDDLLLVADAPSWMTAAVAGLAGEMEEDLPASNETVN